MVAKKFDEASNYISKTYNYTLNSKKISADSLDPVTFLTKLCEEYKNYVQIMKAPHLILDTTETKAISKAIKFFTKALALPIVTTSAYKNAANDAWSNLDQNEMQYLIQVFSPYHAIFSLSKHIFRHQKITNLVIIHDVTLGSHETFLEMFLNVNVRYVIDQIDLKMNIYEKLSNYSRTFSNFFVMGSSQNVKSILEIADSQLLFETKYAWYAFTLDDGIVNCSTCANAKIISVQPSGMHSIEYPIYDKDIPSNDFYSHLFIGSILSLRNSSYVSRWTKYDFINCETYDGNNTPFRENIDLKENLQRYMFNYKPFNMEVKLVHFTDGKIKDSVLIGQWISYEDNEVKLMNKNLWREFIGTEVLKIVVVEQKPFIFLDYSHPRGYNGYLVDMMEEIGQLLGFEFYLELASDNAIGDVDDDGLWNGLIGDILNLKADIGLASIPVSSIREKVIDFTIPYYEAVGSIMLMKLFRTEPSLNKFIDVIETEVWIYILAAYALTSLLIWIFDKYQPEKDPNERIFSLRESLWFCFLSLTPQGTGGLPRNLPGLIVTVSWWLFSFVILASYTANLSAILTVSLFNNQIENINDLEKEYRLKFAPLNGSYTMQYFSRLARIEEMFHHIWKNMTFDGDHNEKAKSKYSVWSYPVSNKYNDIWNSMQSAGFPKTMDEVLERIRRSTSSADGFVFLGDATDCRYLVLTNCDLQTVGEEFSTKPYAIAVPEGSPLKRRLDFAIMELIERGTLQQLKTKWWDRNPDRKLCETENRLDGIGLPNMGGVFGLMLFGIGLAIIVLDKARPHTSILTRQKLRDLGLEVLMHPPYRLDLAPSNTHLFNFAGGKFALTEACENRLSQFLANRDEGFYERGIMVLTSKFQQVIEQNGAYSI
ncbi:ionotropic receptor 25a-like [Harmonia axyridis]|uniref:ionotropic receptor 25a-like n=1 Tax=Harmonia axyridis TaxID=115357 RepID=UPI001E2771F1|nr:ionotropic receptor 25a-like [Harmonia axyridis]